MNEQLAALLERDRDAVCDAWVKRLADPALLAANKLQPAIALPVRPLLDEIVQLLRGGTLKPRPETTQALLKRLGPVAEWRINLCQAIEVLFTGEVVVRYWARAYLDASDAQLLAVFESVNRAFHQLTRDYALRYCDQCHAVNEAAARE